MMCVKQPLNATTSCHLGFFFLFVTFLLPLKMKTKCFLMEKTFYDITFLMNFSTIYLAHMVTLCTANGV